MAGEWNDSTTVDVVKIGGALAALSILMVFLASLASVLFARGLLSKMGFAPSTISVKAGADMFAVFAYTRCLAFVGIGLVGFIPFPWFRISHRIHQFIVLTIVYVTIAMMALSRGTESQSMVIRLPMGALAFVLPIFIGYTFRSTQNTLTQYPKVLIVCVAALSAFGVNLGLIGSGQAMKVMSAGLDNATTLVDRSKTTNSFSVVTLVLKEELPFLIGGRKLEGGYEYAPQSGAFLRFIAEDESKYFLIENAGNVITPFTVRKEAVTAMMFRYDSGVSRPNP
jgi:hypothetical protein